MTVSIEHPTPNSAILTVDGADYPIERRELLPGITMLQLGDAFYERFGPGEELLPLIHASFRKNDGRVENA